MSPIITLAAISVGHSRNALQHSGVGLTVLMVGRVLGDTRLRMKWAKIEAIDMSIVRPKLLPHRLVKALDMFESVVAPSNARLIGDYENAIARVIEYLYALDSCRRKNQVLYTISVAAIDVDHPVSIQKCNRPNFIAFRTRRQEWSGAAVCKTRTRGGVEPLMDISELDAGHYGWIP